MCIGIPMQVIEAGNGYALCHAGDETRQIDTMLVGSLEPGTWLLTFLNTAREIITAEQARQILDALSAVDLALTGNAEPSAIDHLFADLIDREPQLPDFVHQNPDTAKRSD